ncbi:hypothetical protein [Rhizobium sp. 11_C7_N12_5]|uniref:hypothetical protein n=1 Tax=Rhizobium sp. 11_C7_N12_5 TaxID=3240770 RepID=UPI003F1E5A32
MTTLTSIKARIEVFRSGTFKPMEGDAITYSAADLKTIGDVYDRANAPAPIVIGHPKTDAPAFGWVDSFDYDASSDRLFANVSEVYPAFADAVRAGNYKKVSMSFFRPTEPANPVPGSWYPKHVGFLGGAAPAVAGLANVQFAADAATVTFTSNFGDPGSEQAASLFRGLRDFFIDKFGLDDADKALPSFSIDWLSETTATPAVLPDFSATPKFSAGGLIQKVPITRASHSQLQITEKEPSLTLPNPAFAAREAELNTREETLKKREREILHTGHVAFAEALVAGGKLIAASKDKVVAVLDALPVDVSVSFAAGDTTTTLPVATMLREILDAQPKVVSFGQLDLPAETAGGGSASFASDGKAVDAGQLVIHQKALAYVREHPGTDYLAAVHAVS